MPDSDIGRGHEGFFTWLGRLAEGWESWHVEDLQLPKVYMAYCNDQDEAFEALRRAA